MVRQTRDATAQTTRRAAGRDGGAWEVTVRRPDGATPAGRVAELEAELARTRAGLLWTLTAMPAVPLPPREVADVVDAALDGGWGTVETQLDAAHAAHERAVADRRNRRGG